MKTTLQMRPLVAGAAAFTAATTMTSAVALALCAGAPTLVALSGLVGPPSITATETSTDQALELIRRRREEQAGACPAGFTRSGGNCVPTGGAAQVASAQAAPPAPAPQAAAPPPAPPPQATVTTTTTTGPAPAAAAASPQPKRAVSRPAAKAQQQVAQAAPPPSAPVTRAAAPAAPGYGYGGSIKDGGYNVPVPGVVRAYGIWAEGYYDHEKHKNINPGNEANPTRRTTSGGAMSGVDVSQFSIGTQVTGFQIGALAGYNSTRAKFTDFSVTGPAVEAGVQADGTQRHDFSQVRQEVEGVFAGIYGSVVAGPFSADLTFKVDAFEMSRTFLERIFFRPNVDAGCSPPVPFALRSETFNSASTTMTDYIVASNANYRFDLRNGWYLEPTAGLRWTHVDFGGNAAALGVRDGDIFRVQGGLRIGTRFTTPDGWVWRTSLTGLLYSDVSMSGLIAPAAPQAVFNFPTFPLVDEGKLRAMAILDTRVEVGHGYTLYSDLEVRGGEDVFGFGARGGIRYQW